MSLLVFSDLDGTLLDAVTYRADEARPALEALARRAIPLVLCTSKTRPEVDRIRQHLHLDTPFIVENGGAIVVPDVARLKRDARIPGATMASEAWWTIELGVPATTLAAELPRVAADAGIGVRGLSAMALDEVVERTNLPPADAALARMREWSEPFVLTATDADADEALARLADAASRLGRTVTRGGRFFHLCGATSKGDAVRRVVALFAAQGRTFGTTVGLGDAPNDLALLRATSLPIVVPGPSGVVDRSLMESLPGARVAPAVGPRGWNAAVLALLDETR
ncbi:MAG: HAD-IIB family hydrolase [Vicinamibacterales bacterium]